MKLNIRLLAGGLVLGTALAVSGPAEGWTTIGGSPSLSQWDFRICDNFTRPALHGCFLYSLLRPASTCRSTAAAYTQS